MNRSGWRPRLAALITAIVVSVGLLSLSSLPAWAAAGTVTEFNVPGGVFGITAGPDGNLWFTGAGAIGRITPSGSITLFPVPGSAPGAITAGPDGNLWFLDNGTGKIGRITTAGLVTEFSVPTASTLQRITAGPDGNLWFTEDVLSSTGQNNKIDGKIGRITTGGSITEFPLPKNCAFEFCGPVGITAGPDGNVWFAATDVNKIGRITPAGSITEFPLPTTCGSSNGCGPYAITAGPDGALWFTEAANDIGRITPAGLVTQFPVAGVCVPNEGCGAFGITAGPDGNLWFTEGAADNTDDIGRITPTGSFTAFPLPTDGSDGSEPYNITPGPDGKSLWFTEVLAREIGRITTQ